MWKLPFEGCRTLTVGHRELHVWPKQHIAVFRIRRLP